MSGSIRQALEFKNPLIVSLLIDSIDRQFKLLICASVMKSRQLLKHFWRSFLGIKRTSSDISCPNVSGIKIASASKMPLYSQCDSTIISRSALSLLTLLENDYQF